jgi:NAD(P)-dependent dehydrogenase (short-subunit alcohol dehydrogenase family)
MLLALEALASALALELAPVRVNAVTPGLIDTPLLHDACGAERDTIIKNRAAISPAHLTTLTFLILFSSCASACWV